MSAFLTLALFACGPMCQEGEAYLGGECVPPEEDEEGTIEDAGAACDAYIDAHRACFDIYQDAVGTGAGTFPYTDDYCEAYFYEVEDAAVATWLRCRRDAFEGADCSTSEGYSVAARAAEDCREP